MYCPVCRAENGDFAVRCRKCGGLLATTPGESPDRERNAASQVPVVTAIAVAGVVVITVLIGLITYRGLWAQVLGVPVAGPDVFASQLASTPISATPRGAMSRPPAPAGLPLAIGESADAGPWRFAIDQASFGPDETANGWRQATITYTVANISPQSAHLTIPSTVVEPTAVGAAHPSQPSFIPLPSVENATTTELTGLRLYLMDASHRSFGGGFGASEGAFELMAAPGDTLRLGYHFRFPSDSAGPFTLRLAFPSELTGKVFDVRLDRTAASPVSLRPGGLSPPVALMTPTTVGEQWSISCLGVEFGTTAGEGERPVTVLLDVANLTADSKVALADPDDSLSASRDFYLTDSDGNVAYSHADDAPGVVVPAHSQREVMVRLYTLSLLARARPLTFTAVLNWRTNRFARFQID
jgi:hypothetical protein